MKLETDLNKIKELSEKNVTSQSVMVVNEITSEACSHPIGVGRELIGKKEAK